ncbi:MAG: hypothetical protein E4H28_01060 [Gemmatimonadales bacterium]|nr:MAG: hypothetical protein E4H28_01060 [Gemmatimonadales bacterium]
MHRQGFVATFAAALLLSPVVAVAQDPNLVDQGRYDITVGNRMAGTETFAIRRQGEGYMAVGRIQLEGEGTWIRSAEFGLRTDGSFAPVRFETRALGRPAYTLIVTRSGTRLRITTSSEEGDRMTELLAAPDQVLLGTGIAQHYYFVIRRLTAAGGQSVELGAILPGDGQEQPIRVVGVDKTEITIGEAMQPANRYELDVGTTRHIVWADVTNGHILKVEVPDRQWTSIRQPGN